MEIKNKLGIKRDRKVCRFIVDLLIAEKQIEEFGVNPKELSDDINNKYEFDSTPIEIGHKLKKMGFGRKIITGKLYRLIDIDRLKVISEDIENAIEY